ncbi:polysaccharide biosynthesis protein [Bacillus sp. M6-12]|uniref:putative polysaccharide biosynthesis protein n=1 Tax=Bacillus sp. M6-12 TaxID=2054166 RepID=UPI000C76539A|nr:polysaccharide biosynthesis protein [Bacillus sp. M6-12]PLS15128.1 polysaccharide biosynthesis protein [Bacillus sp. M6-12]
MAQRLDLSKKLFRGAVILTVAALVTKILSAAYRIPFQNIAGDIGFYIYQQVYPFYGIALIFSTYGFPAVISKLVAEQRQEDNQFIQTILIPAFLIIGGIGSALCSLFYWGADWIASAMKDPELAGPIKLISFSFLLMPVISVLRGYYQGKSDMFPTAVSQVAEQLIRVCGILIFSLLLLWQGKSLYEIGFGAYLGSLLGGLACVTVLLLFMWKRKDLNLFQKKFLFQQRIKWKSLSKILLFQGLAFCMTSLILVLIQLVDSWHLYSLLLDSGMEQDSAKALKGVYDRGQPLLQLGTVVASSLSLTLIPLISGYLKKGKFEEIEEKIRLSFRISITVGLGAAIGLLLLIESANYMLFEDSKGSGTLGVLSLSIFFTSLVTTSSSILQSMGHYRSTVIVLMLGILSKWVLNLLFVPLYSITGAALASVISFIFMSVLLHVRLKKYLRRTLLGMPHFRWLARGILAMAIVLVIHGQVFQLFPIEGRLFASLQALTGVLIGGTIYLVLIIRSGMFSFNELVLLPFGSKLALLLRQKHERELSEFDE